MWTCTYSSGMTRTYGDAVTSRALAVAYFRNIGDMYGYRIACLSLHTHTPQGDIMCTDLATRTSRAAVESARDARARTLDNAPLADAIRRHLRVVSEHVAATGCTDHH